MSGASLRRVVPAPERTGEPPGPAAGRLGQLRAGRPRGRPREHTDQPQMTTVLQTTMLHTWL